MLGCPPQEVTVGSAHGGTPAQQASLLSRDVACNRLQAQLLSTTAVFHHRCVSRLCHTQCAAGAAQPTRVPGAAEAGQGVRAHQARRLLTIQPDVRADACLLAHVGNVPKLLRPALHQPRVPAAVHLCMCLTRPCVRRVRSVGSVCGAALSFRCSPIRCMLAAR